MDDDGRRMAANREVVYGIVTNIWGIFRNRLYPLPQPTVRGGESIMTWCDIQNDLIDNANDDLRKGYYKQYDASGVWIEIIHKWVTKILPGIVDEFKKHRESYNYIYNTSVIQEYYDTLLQVQSIL